MIRDLLDIGAQLVVYGGALAALAILLTDLTIHAERIFDVLFHGQRP